MRMIRVVKKIYDEDEDDEDDKMCGSQRWGHDDDVDKRYDENGDYLIKIMMRTIWGILGGQQLEGVHEDVDDGDDGDVEDDDALMMQLMTMMNMMRMLRRQQ